MTSRAPQHLSSSKKSDADDIQPVLRVSGLTVAHGARILVRDATFQLDAGCLALLTGANGQGKTTLLRAIMGLHAVNEGEIQIFGQGAQRGRGLIGYLPQERRLPAPQLPARDLIASAWRARYFGPLNFLPRCRREVARVCALTGITHLVHRPIGQLSGGEKQRVFLAIALLGEPRFLLLDEPLTRVDNDGASQLIELLNALCEDMNMAILLSTHHLSAFKKSNARTLHLRGQKLEVHDV